MDNYDIIYFLGIGGIGMSNLARYFMMKNKIVMGYDKTKTPLTEALSSEGAKIHYDEDLDFVNQLLPNKNKTLVIFTPAIPNQNKEKLFFESQGFIMKKRAQVLGMITKNTKALCCAGTHGKTTTSSMVAHIFMTSQYKCNAFLGGILKNNGTNLILSQQSEYTVIEADEYDRSFHWLHPYMALITSVTPDHLDIYGTKEAYLDSFKHFISLINSNGCLVIHNNALRDLKCNIDNVKTYSYGLNEGDFHAKNIKIGNGELIFDFVTPSSVIKEIKLGVPIKINIENAIGSMAIGWLNDIEPKDLKTAMETFQGANRRFDFKIKQENLIYIDDYAHHPEELDESISSVKALYPDKKVVGIFQPHLYSRTKDFAKEFASALSLLDSLILMDIYPAREEPIEGVNSEMLMKYITCPVSIKNHDEIVDWIDLNKEDLEVVLTLGAGDIDKLVEPLTEILKNK